MKILRITIHNIASLAGRHTIDFKHEPLRSAGLFSISGPTGSGKSTILDALCLALFSKTPRLTAIGTLEEVDGEGQKDPRSLLRRGTGEGLAEVAFIGVDQDTYTARWIVRRAHKKVSGKLQNVEMTLFKGNFTGSADGVVVAGGNISEVKPAIVNRIGLTFDQFTRAVLLAQNDFATFLKAKDSERAGILQALTGTERFERISKTVFERASALSREMELLEAKAGGVQLLSPEARAEAEAAGAEADAGHKLLKNQLDERKRQVEWFANLKVLEGAASSARDDLANARQRQKEAAPRKLERDLTDDAHRTARPLRVAELSAMAAVDQSESALVDFCREAEAARQVLAQITARENDASAAVKYAQTAADEAGPLLARARELDGQLKPLTDQLRVATEHRGETARKLGTAKQSLDTANGKLQALKDELSNLEQSRVDQANLEPFATDATAWVERIERWQSSHREASLIKTELAKLRSTLEEKKAEHHRAEANAATLADEHGGVVMQSDAADRELMAFNVDDIVREQSDAVSVISAFKELLKWFADVQELTVRLPAAEAMIAQLEREQNQRKTQTASLEQQRDAAKIAVEAVAGILNNAEAVHRGATLRAGLEDGKPCPVCGAVEHPFAAHPPDDDENVLKSIRQSLKERERAYEDLMSQLQNQARQQASAAATLIAEREKLADLDARLSKLRGLRPVHSAVTELLAFEESEQPAKAQQLVERQSAVCEDCDARLKARGELDQRCQTLRREVGEKQRQLTALRDRLQELTGELTKLTTQCDGKSAALVTAEKLVTDHTEQLEPFRMACPQLLNAAANDERTVARVRNALSEFLSLVSCIREATRAVERATVTCSGSEEEHQRLQSELAASQTRETEAREQWQAVDSERAKLFDRRNADDEESSLRTRVSVARAGLETVRSEKAAAEPAFTKASAAVDTAKQSVSQCRTNVTSAVAAMDRWLQEFPQRWSTVCDRQRLDVLLARDDRWLRDEFDALQGLDTDVVRLTGQCEARDQAVRDHRSTPLTTDSEDIVSQDRERLVTEHTAAEERLRSVRSVLDMDDQRRRDSAAFADELASRQKAARPWLKLNELIGSKDGAKFRLIAQQYTLDLLLQDANAQLDVLARRYQLARLPESLNLVVIDRDMGDDQRSVYSLSGGESFLVSLGLALGLASLASNRLQIESLFIDEGFGSLDQDTLRTAMDALMRLESQGRKVGVISHVTEMTNAISVGIEVKRARGGASRILVAGVTAEVEAGVVIEEVAKPTRKRRSAAKQ